MASVNLSVAPREGTGKGVARRLRAEHRVPAILYGFGTEPQPVSLDSIELLKALKTPAGIRVVLQLQVEGEGKPFAVLVKDLQKHPLTREIIHIDLLSIDIDKPVDVSIPIKPVGTPIGVRAEGGNLEWQRRELEIRVLPTAIPEAIEINIDDLHLNDALHIGDLEVGDAELLEDSGLTVCSVKTTRMSVAVDEGVEGEEGEGEEAAGEGEAADGEAEGGDAES